MPKATWFLTLLLSSIILFPSANASEHHQRRLELPRRTQIRIRDAENRAISFAEHLSADLAAKSKALSPNSDTLAHNLVANVIYSVCNAYFRSDDAGSFDPSIVKDCVKNVYGQETMPQAAAQFYAVFGASLLCDFVVSEAYPVAQEFVSDGCEGLQSLMKVSPAAVTASSFHADALTTEYLVADQIPDALPTGPPPFLSLSASAGTSASPSFDVSPLRASALDAPISSNTVAEMSKESGLSPNAANPSTEAQRTSQSFVSAESSATSDIPKINSNALIAVALDPSKDQSRSSSIQGTIVTQDMPVLPTEDRLSHLSQNFPTISPPLLTPETLSGTLQLPTTAAASSSAKYIPQISDNDTTILPPTQSSSRSNGPTPDPFPGISTSDAPLVRSTTPALGQEPIDDSRLLVPPPVSPAELKTSSEGSLASMTNPAKVGSQLPSYLFLVLLRSRRACR